MQPRRSCIGRLLFLTRKGKQLMVTKGCEWRLGLQEPAEQESEARARLGSDSRAIGVVVSHLSLLPTTTTPHYQQTITSCVDLPLGTSSVSDILLNLLSLTLLLALTDARRKHPPHYRKATQATHSGPLRQLGRRYSSRIHVLVSIRGSKSSDGLFRIK